MMKSIVLLLTTFIFILSGCAQSNSNEERSVGSSCEDCEMMFEGMPQNLLWQTTISGSDEPGEPLIIRGTIFKPDGKTPAPDVILYVYHTNSKGKYSPTPKQTDAKRHGHLRGWIKTDAQGRYEFKTIRPGSYPFRKDPQHIHPIVKESNTSVYWIDEFLFDDDPLLTEEQKVRHQKRGGSGIITLTKDANGVWIGRRDIILGLNVPGY
ncbi:MAG: intradiol ring-cleavage dioxygenase [Cyclobacteriaceae bacterium]|nr:intradiol ring-cleavage dioxygenase [Cyclobacteriaceae bacterium]